MTQRDSAQTWRQLRFLNYYRLILAGLLAGLCLNGHLPVPLGQFDAALFWRVSFLYLAACVLAALAIRWRRPALAWQAPAHVFIDILAITLLMHASGGVSSGLGMLLIISVAGGSLLMEGRTARLFAAVAALAVLAEQAWSWLHDGPPTSYTHAGLLGASFFATAILAHSLAERLRESEALAERRGLDLANMAQLTEYVIQRMQTGILVLDRSFGIRLVNESARRLLDMHVAEGQSIARICPALAAQLQDWWDGRIAEPGMFRGTDTGPEILPRFARLGSARDAGTLVFLEDTAAMAQQAQQLKLAALGRLTASIAHEVRNPLGAISHAGQLLAESPQLDAGDRRLTEIIHEHTERVNTIIENIMQLSRGQPARPEELALRPWLERFIHEFTANEGLAPDRVRLAVQPPSLRVQADPSQLHQVLWNLCHNGLKHGGRTLLLRAGMAPDSHTPFLDIVDDGPGIDAVTAQHIFEPFFTTSPHGTGMGLYIARELCMSNQARLNYLHEQRGGCFRITFADPRRRQVA